MEALSQYIKASSLIKAEHNLIEYTTGSRVINGTPGHITGSHNNPPYALFALRTDLSTRHKQTCLYILRQAIRSKSDNHLKVNNSIFK